MPLIKQSGKSKRRFVSTILLKKQAACIGRIALECEDCCYPPKYRRRVKFLNGVWELLHVILDDLEAGKECILERK